MQEVVLIGECLTRSTYIHINLIAYVLCLSVVSTYCNVTNNFIFGGIDEVQGISCDCRHHNKNVIIYSLDPYLDKQQSFENIIMVKIQKFSCLRSLENLSSLSSKKR